LIDKFGETYLNPIDLTMTLSSELPSFPGSPQPHFIPWSKIAKEGYNLELIFLSTHSGTHLDAPYHFVNNGTKINQIPLRRLICNAILIRLIKQKNELITKSEIVKFERKFGKIPKGSAVVFLTRWEKYLTKKFFFKNNPGLTNSAALYLQSRKVNLVGIDAPSIDPGNKNNFSVHKIFAKNNILIAENLCNLEKIPSIHFKLMIIPLKLKNSTGSPVRAIAI